MNARAQPNKYMFTALQGCRPGNSSGKGDKQVTVTSVVAKGDNQVTLKGCPIGNTEPSVLLTVREPSDILPKINGRIPSTPIAIRLSQLFNRRLTTAWSEEEYRAYRALGPINEEDLTMIENYYEKERCKGSDGNSTPRPAATLATLAGRT